MAVRKIIEIDEDKCNGCGLCAPNCAEGAIRIINGKARLVKDSFCDGLGACIGHCPTDALKIVEREADDFDEEEVMKHVKLVNAKNGANAAPNPGFRPEPPHGGCPGSRAMLLKDRAHGAKKGISVGNGDVEIRIKPQLAQWPVQLKLVPVNAPYFSGSDLLVTADCVPFAYADYHLGLLKGKALVIGCPKLDDIDFYTEKLIAIMQQNDIKSVTVAHMEVPCCSAIVRAVDFAVGLSGKNIPVKKVMVTLDGTATASVDPA